MGFLWDKSYPTNVDYKSKIKTGLLHEIFQKSAKEYADKIFLNFLGKAYTYEAAKEIVDQLATGLQELGVKKGVHVGLFLPNAPAYAFFNLAILQAGGIVVNFNPLYAHDEVVYQTKDSDIEYMVTHDLSMLTEKILPLLDETQLKRVIIWPFKDMLPPLVRFFLSVFKRSLFAKLPEDPRILFVKDFMKDPSIFKAPKVNENDVAFLQYTGGTTGRSKGAMLTHNNMIANIDFALRDYPIIKKDGSEVFLAILPFFHIYGLTTQFYFPIWVGASIVFIFPRFELNETIKLIHKHKVTMLIAVPTVYLALSKHPKAKEYLASLKLCLSGADTLPLSTKQAFEKASGSVIVEGYGLTEAAPVVASLPESAQYKESSVGLPAPGCEVAFLDIEDHKTFLPLGERGEICVKGPQVMKGYYKKPKETKNVMIDGFLRTGDIGYMDEDGYIFIVDRAKDLVIVSGYNVYPRHVQDAIYKHPAVEETTVIGVPDEYQQQHVKAFIKLKEGYILTKEDLLHFLKDKLSPFEMPKEVEFRDELPKTLVGKLSKKELVEEELRKHEPKVEEKPS